MKFACDSIPCEGMITGQIGSYLIFEGIAADAGSYFIHNAAIGDARRFPSRADAEDYARELAMDAAGSYETMPEYKEGFESYKKGNLRNPYPGDSVKAQAWDRGSNAAMQSERGKAQDASTEEDLKAFHDFEHGTKIKPGSEKTKKVGHKIMVDLDDEEKRRQAAERKKGHPYSS